MFLAKKLVSKVIRFQRSPLKQARQMSNMNMVTERHENGYEHVRGHGCRHENGHASAFKVNDCATEGQLIER